MNGCVLVSWLVMCALPAHGFQWISRYNSTTEVCLGENVIFNWDYRADASDTIINTLWYFQPATGGRPKLVAAKLDDDFLVVSQLGKNLVHIHDAGISVSNADRYDAGQYYVKINVESPNQCSQNLRYAYLSVLDGPKMTSANNVNAGLLGHAIMDFRKTEARAYLYCTGFQSLGGPGSVSVQWRTPTGLIRDSTEYKNGQFLFQLPFPVVPGTYACIPKLKTAANPCGGQAASIPEVSVHVTEAEACRLIVDREVRYYGRRKKDYSGDLCGSSSPNFKCRPQSCQEIRTYCPQDGERTIYVGTSQTRKRVYCRQASTPPNRGNTGSSWPGSGNTAGSWPSGGNTAGSRPSSGNTAGSRPSSGNTAGSWPSGGNTAGSWPSGGNTAGSRPSGGNTAGSRPSGGNTASSWTLIQKRRSGRVNFNRNWAAYENGFGNPRTEYWMGLRGIYQMTNGRPHNLRVDLWSKGKHGYAEYDSFYIDGPHHNYRLHVSGYRAGDLGDSLSKELSIRTGYKHDGMEFSTRDRDHDKTSWSNCARTYSSGWWFNKCHQVDLNAPFRRNNGRGRNALGPVWKSWYLGEKIDATEMKIRPRQ